jgi:hypothetical protein
MSMQNEDTNVNGSNNHLSTPNNAGNAGTGDKSTFGTPTASPGNQQSSPHTSQQAEMPPSQTDDDQYDQGTVKRAP